MPALLSSLLLGALVAGGEPAALYKERCAICHGEEGRGDGPAAARLPVPPADFTSGTFKLRSTPSGAMPTDDDLRAVITRGIGGAGMPSFAALSPAERDGLVREVKRLTRSRDTGESYFDSRPASPVVSVPPRPKADRATLARGKQLYDSLACASCHGREGRGDGSSAAQLRDYAGRPLRPTDFTLWAFKAGADARELYKRIATGLNGTPMAEYGDDVMSGADRWALVEYLLSLVGR
jgi:mono/diheme cytochrome c family protein